MEICRKESNAGTSVIVKWLRAGLRTNREHRTPGTTNNCFSGRTKDKVFKSANSSCSKHHEITRLRMQDIKDAVVYPPGDETAFAGHTDSSCFVDKRANRDCGI